jgi:single-strand DNA-binding protein
MTRAAAALKKGAQVLAEGELRSREYEREVSAGSQTGTVSQRVWEIRVDQMIKLDRTPRNDSGDEPGPP